MLVGWVRSPVRAFMSIEYVWGGNTIVCWVTAYFFLPEFKHRSYRELDILFNRKGKTTK
jgi:hypothetical protein